MLTRGKREIADDIEAVSTSRCPPGDSGNNDLGHRSNQALNLEDVESPRPRGINLFPSLFYLRRGLASLNFIAVAILAADALVATRTKRITAVARGGAIARQNDGSDVTGHSRMIKATVEFVDRMRAECIANFRTVKSDANDGQILAFGGAVDRASGNPTMVGHIGELEALNLAPALGIESIRNKIQCTHTAKNTDLLPLGPGTF